MYQPTAPRLALPRTYFESMVEADILVVYRGRMYTPIVAPSPEQATQYSAASLRLAGSQFVLEPLEKLTVVEDRYLNGRAMHAALQQYQHDYLSSIGNAAISADLQDEMLETALLRFVTDEVFPSFATSDRTLGRLLDRKFAHLNGEDEPHQPREDHARHRPRHSNQHPPAASDDNRARIQAGNTRFVRALLNNNAEQVDSSSVAEQLDMGSNGQQARTTPPSAPLPNPLPQWGEGNVGGDSLPRREEGDVGDDNLPPTLAAAPPSPPHPNPIPQWGEGNMGGVSLPHPQAIPIVVPNPPEAPLPEQPGIERNFSRLLRYSTTTRSAPPPPAPLPTRALNNGATMALPAQQPDEAETARVVPTPPAPPLARPPAGSGSGTATRERQSQRGLTQPHLVAPPAPPQRQFSMVEQLLGLTNFAVIEGIIYTMQPARASDRADVRMGNHEFSVRPYMLLADLLNHYNSTIAEMLRNEARANQPAVQQVRQDRRYVEEKLQRNYGAAGLSLERINARSYFLCLGIQPFANRGSDGKFYVFSAALMREMARRAAMDINTVRDPLKVAIQVTINWSARGFEKITAGEPIMLGPSKGPFISWARELAFHDGIVVDRDVCTDNYQPPPNLSFGAGIANKLETARRIIMSGYILGAVRPRSLLT
ncbi:MAG: hypothetical protein DLM69_07570, partial [Candidatus Chloroheliales bacterium]